MYCRECSWYDVLTTFINLNFATMNQLQAFVLYVCNQRKNDKFSLSYFIGMNDPHHVYHFYPEETKRQELLAELIRLVSIDGNLDKCIQSDYTRKQLQTIIDNQKPS